MNPPSSQTHQHTNKHIEKEKNESKDDRQKHTHMQRGYPSLKPLSECGVCCFWGHRWWWDVSWHLDVVMWLSSEGCNVWARWGRPFPLYHHQLQYNSHKTFWDAPCQSPSVFLPLSPPRSLSWLLPWGAGGRRRATEGVWRLAQRGRGWEMEWKERGKGMG